MNPLQFKIVHYLSEEGHKERAQAFEDLSERGAFNNDMPEADAQWIVKCYLEANPRGFCEEGIARFREHMGWAPKTRTIRFEGEIEVPVDQYPESDGRVARTLSTWLAGTSVWIDSYGNQHKMRPVTGVVKTTTDSGKWSKRGWWGGVKR